MFTLIYRKLHDHTWATFKLQFGTLNRPQSRQGLRVSTQISHQTGASSWRRANGGISWL